MIYKTWYQVETGTENYGIAVNSEGVIVDAPRNVSWMIGESVKSVSMRSYFLKNNFKVYKIAVQKC